MNPLFSIMIAIAMGAVLISLGLGLFVMLKGGETSKAYSNKLMQARVTLQGVAILLFVIAFMSKG